MKFLRSALVALLTLVAVSSSFAQAEAQLNKEMDLGVSVGMLFPGSIWVSAANDHILSKMSPLVRVTFDGYIVPKLTMGVYSNIGFVSFDKFDKRDIPVPSAMNSATAIEFGASITPCFLVDNVRIKPGLCIGYRIFHLNTDADIDTKDTKGMGVNATVQTTFLTGGKVSPFVEVGFLAQPVGGNDDTDLTFAPIFYLAVGATI